MLRDLRRTADVLREPGSAKNGAGLLKARSPTKSLRKFNFLQRDADSCESFLRSQRDASGPRNERVGQTPADAPSQHGLPTSMEQLDVRHPTVELETTPFLPVLEPVSKPTQLSETTEPRAKQPRIGERVYPSPLPLPIPSTPLS